MAIVVPAVGVALEPVPDIADARQHCGWTRECRDERWQRPPLLPFVPSPTEPNRELDAGTSVSWRRPLLTPLAVIIRASSEPTGVRWTAS